MNWALPSLAIVVATLLSSLWWYERTRPSARTVALVGTLAALAAIGRLAFAPIPGVTPTTDIILLAGVALGAAPGFAVGAVAALASNVIFGQGPWTPWQMLAWGCCGLLGAGLGAVFRQRLGRWRLAAGGLVAGLLFGLIMNVSTWLTFTSGAEGGTLLAVSATAAPFDVAHALGNVAFALAFGPALLLALRRTQARREGRFAEPEELPAVGGAGGTLPQGGVG